MLATNLENAIPKDDILHPQNYDTIGLHSLFEERKLRRIVSVDPSENLSRISSTGRFVVLRQDSQNICDGLKCKPNNRQSECQLEKTAAGQRKIKLGVSSYVDKDTCESAV